MRRFYLFSAISLTVLLLVGLARLPGIAVAVAVQSTDVVRDTPTATPAATSIPTTLGWRGQIVSNTLYATPGNGSIVRVRVFERLNEPITLTHYETTLSGLSGTKPEYGPYAAEFAPLPAGRWTVSLPNLGASVEIEADGYNLVVVEFAPYTPTEAPVAAQTPPTPTPLGGQSWEGRVLNVSEGPLPEGAILRVTVQGQSGHTIQVSTPAGFATRSTTGAKEELGPYTAEFAPLTSGRYTITPAGLNASLTVDVKQYSTILVEFRPVSDSAQSPATFTPVPATPTPQPSPTPTPLIQWMGRVVHNSSQPWPSNQVDSAIAVRVQGQRGQTVSLQASGGRQALCDTGAKVEYEEDACEFGELWPGVYRVSPVGIPAQVQLYMDGVGLAVVVFETLPATATPAPTPTRLIGAGAWPLSTPTVTSTTTPTPTITGTPTRASPSASFTPTRPSPVATATLTPTLAPTPTPARGWVGRVVQDDAGVGAGTIVVRVLGAKDQPIIIRSGPWEVRGLTGSKPEYGDNAVEFGGLNQGDFTVELEGLGASLPVHLQPGGFVLVEFGYGLLPTPTSTPQSGVWVGAVTRNTSGDGASGAWSTIIVKIPAMEGLTVTLDSGGSFTTTCVTGTKPEYGPGACDVGGLWPGMYRVTPQGLGPSVDVWLDGQGSATVEFWIR